jgi:hypothetical protein
MKRAGLLFLPGLVGAWLLMGLPSAARSVTLPACDDFKCAFDGDFAVMSLPIAGVNVPSTPGHIKDLIVIYTGTNNANALANFAGMDDAYPAPSGKATSFSTTAATDPGGAGQFGGDADATWDSTLAAFLGFLGGSNPIFFFNHNQSNTGTAPSNPCGMQTAQDLCAYGMLTLVDLGNSANNVILELEPPTTLFSGGAQPTDNSTTLPADYVLAPGAVCLDALGNQQACDGTQTLGPINHNLGADNAAYAIFSPELNAKLALCRQHGVNTTQCPWDVLQIRLDLDGLTNGYEQLFVAAEDQIPVPQPAPLLLLGSGLAALALTAWRRRGRGRP